MTRKKLTLSIDEELIKEVKLVAERNGVSLSRIVEEYFEYLVATKWIEVVAEELGLNDLEPTSEHDIPSSRPRGLDATQVVKELRSGRVEKLVEDQR